MRRTLYLIVVQLFLVVLLTSSATLAQTVNPNASGISFTVSMSKPWTHLLEVEMSFKVAANLNVPNETNLVMPVWTPGSYLIREFERHVLDTEAHEVFSLWRYRIVPYRSYVKGWKVSPSHYVNQDLATVWLDK